jgi:hypothetical protein
VYRGEKELYPFFADQSQTKFAQKQVGGENIYRGGRRVGGVQKGFCLPEAVRSVLKEWNKDAKELFAFVGTNY